MTDYLAKIAAMTVECFDPYCREDGKDIGAPLRDCRRCRGTRRILDPRFDGLRITECSHGGHALTEDECGVYLTGYTINRDLEVLLEIIPTLCSDTFILMYGKDTATWAVAWQTERLSRADIPLEAAAHAVYEWLTYTDSSKPTPVDPE